MNDQDKSELANLVAAAVTEVMITRRPKWYETIRRALVQMAVSALGASVLVIIGFWLNGIKSDSDEAASAAEAATTAAEIATDAVEEMKTTAKDAAASNKGATDRNKASIDVMRDTLANVDAQVKLLVERAKAPLPVVGGVAEPNADQLESSISLIKQREDKEIYRLQQQRALDAPPAAR